MTAEKCWRCDGKGEILTPDHDRKPIPKIWYVVPCGSCDRTVVVQQVAQTYKCELCGHVGEVGNWELVR